MTDIIKNKLAAEKTLKSAQEPDGKKGGEKNVELPVSAWFDEQAASALREYNELRRRCRRGRDPPRWLLARRSVARQRYRRLRATKMACFAQKWARFWEDVRCNHVSVWRVIRGSARRSSPAGS